MKKFVVLICMLLLGASSVKAADVNLSLCEYSDEYIAWLNLSSEEKANTIMPSMCKQESESGLVGSRNSYSMEKFTLQDSYISLDFSAGYAKLEPTMEILCRAAIVKSVTQLPRVSNVEITINGQPITNQDNQVVGIMNGDSFISEDTGLSSYGVYGEISLYFADSSGEKLVEYQTQLDMESNSPIEKKVIEQLIEGPKDSKLQSTIPEGTKVIKTSLKDGVCYVDLNAKFLNGVPGVNDELVVYSIVDSLVELPTINKVQFTIEGQRVAKYRETIPFDGTFERNLDIMKKKH